MNDPDAVSDQAEARWDIVARSASTSTFAMLHALLAQRTDGELIGCIIDETTATVHWDTLINSGRLSSTERAITHIARGCKIIERHGIRPDHRTLVTTRSHVPRLGRAIAPSIPAVWNCWNGSRGLQGVIESAPRRPHESGVTGRRSSALLSPGPLIEGER